MSGNQAVVLSCQPVEHPLSTDAMRIVEGTVNAFGLRFVPTRPRSPIQVRGIKARWELIRLVIEKALADTEFLFALIVLQSAPQNFVDKLFEFAQFFFV